MDHDLTYVVYVLECKDGFYIGCTDNLENRLDRHIKGQVLATKDRRPIHLKNTFGFGDRYKAYIFERYLKSGSGRAFLNKHFS